jgi:hypothetical protein
MTTEERLERLEKMIERMRNIVVTTEIRVAEIEKTELIKQGKWYAPE